MQILQEQKVAREVDFRLRIEGVSEHDLDQFFFRLLRQFECLFDSHKVESLGYEIGTLLMGDQMFIHLCELCYFLVSVLALVGLESVLQV